MNVAALNPVSAAASSVRTSHLTGAALRAASPEVQRATVAAQFEAILVRQLLGKTMSSMLGGSEGGAAGSVYGDMLTDTFAQQLTAGPGLGIGRLLEKQLAPRAARSPQPATLVSPDALTSPIEDRS